MVLKPWLEEALGQGRISIAEAINVNKSRDPDWEFLICTKKLVFEKARRVIGLRESQKVPIAVAVSFFERASSKPQTSQKVARTGRPIDGNRAFTKDALAFLEKVDAMRKRPAIEQVRFFISDWESTLLVKRAPVSDDLADQDRP